MTSERGPGTHLLLTVAAVLFATAGPVIAAAVGSDEGETVTPSRMAADRACAPAAAPEPERTAAFVPIPVAAATEPTGLAVHPRSPGDGVLAQRTGQLRRVEDGAVTGEILHDLSDDTAQDGDGGLLAVTYDPAGEWLYAYRTTAGLDDSIMAFRSDDTGRIDPSTARRILFVERHPSKQHHGGSMVFGPDGYLYVGLGDGGGLGDPRENAQDSSTILGKVIRIDPTPAAAQPYRTPPDNPFADRYGWRPEIWALGVRNPFRISIDDTGVLWLGDVGQTCWEEINRLGPDDAGANLGWDRMEGPAPFEGGELRGGRHHAPVTAIPHSAGWCAIVVGPVLSDQAVPERDGWLLFTDYCAGRLMALDTSGDGEEPRLLDLGVEVDSPIAIVTGPTGLPWMLTLDGPILELRDFSRPPAGSTAATP